VRTGHREVIIEDTGPPPPPCLAWNFDALDSLLSLELSLSSTTDAWPFGLCCKNCDRER